MVWANPRMRQPLNSMRREWAWLRDNARDAPPEFKAYWQERAEALAEGIMRREAQDAEEAAEARVKASRLREAERTERQQRLEKAFPAMREARLEARKSRTTGRP